MSVTEAAKIVGASRPGVSSFLNGKVATTFDMAPRIERAFGVPAQTLLDMQAAYEAAQNGPTVVAADSYQEALAFLAQLTVSPE